MSSKKKDLDSISHLPDSILHSILSFLDIREVFQTRVLSKGWEHLWTDISTLNFDFDSFPFEGSICITRNHSKEQSFMRFFFKVLSEFCSTGIKKLSYTSTIPNDITGSIVKLLICYAQTHKVQEICFNTNDHVYYNWPCCLSECFHLTTLKIKCGFVDYWEALELPSLRSLEMECKWEYRNKDDEYKGIQMFSGCPKLKSLVLINYLFQSASICPPHLENLEFCVSSTSKLKSNFPNFPHIELLSSRLRTVKFSNVLPTLKLALGNSCIHQVYIEVEDFNRKSATNFTELLRVFRNARSFILPLKTMQVLMLAADSLSGRPLFCNLRYLRLKTKETKKMIAIDLPVFMQKCPKLKTLTIDSN